MLEPRKPEHADKIVSIPGADPRLALRRHLAGYGYPANGNLHNPTPRYEWHLLADGKVVDSAPHKRDLVTAARDNGDAYLRETTGAIHTSSADEGQTATQILESLTPHHRALLLSCFLTACNEEALPDGPEIDKLYDFVRINWNRK